MGQFIDLTGRVFESWTVLRRGKSNIDRKPSWLCRCKCGKRKLVMGNSLRLKISTSCGCTKNAKLSQFHTHDLTGQKFGRLTVIERRGTKSLAAAWLCRCRCGNEVVVRNPELVGGDTKSCGCLHIEKAIMQLQQPEVMRKSRMATQYRFMLKRIRQNYS